MYCIEKIESIGKGKYRVILEDGTKYPLYFSELRRLHMEEGSMLTEEQYQLLHRDILGKRAKKRALHLLEKMDRSEHQLRQKLLEAEYPSSCVDEAIDYVKSFHYIDDERYAHNYTRYAKERLSRQQIKQKLLAKGISSVHIEQAIACEYDTDESIQIRKLLEKKHFDSTCDDPKSYRRIYQYLLRRGFHNEDIIREMKLFQEVSQ